MLRQKGLTALQAIFDMGKEKSKVQLFVQGSFLLVISSVCIKAINFLLLPLYTNNLTPAMLGVSDSITTFTGILFPILVLGLDSAYSAFYFDKHDKQRDLKVFSTIGIFFWGVGIVPIMMSFFSTPISLLLFHTDSYEVVVTIALWSVTMNLWYLPFSLELRLKNRMGLFGLASVIASLSMVLLNVLFVSILKMGEMSLVLSSTVVACEYLVIYVLFVGHVPRRRHFDMGLLKKMIVFALPLLPSVIMAWTLSLSDRYILLHYHGDDCVGLYGIGARFVTILNVVINAVSTAYTTFAFGSKDDENAQEKYYYIFNTVSVLLIAVAFTMAVFSKEIIHIMTDDAYESSYVIIRDMMFGQVFYAMSIIVSYGIVFKKKSVYSLVAVSSGAIVNLVLNFVFIPQYGLVAAALTTLIGYFISLVVCYYFSEKLYPCNYGFKRVMLSCFITYLISMVTQEFLWQVRLVVWIVCCVLFGIFYRDILGIVIRFVKSFLKTLAKR